MAIPRKLREVRGWTTVKDPNSDNRTVLASPNMGKFRGTPVFLWVEDKSLNPKMVDADLHDELAKSSNNASLLELEICCPRCSAWNRIPGNKKSIDVRYLDTPRSIQHPHDGEIVHQTAVVRIEEPLTCSEPMGKSICGYTFIIRDNRIIRA